MSRDRFLGEGADCTIAGKIGDQSFATGLSSGDDSPIFHNPQPSHMQCPGPPGAPTPSNVSPTAIELKWEPPEHHGGSALRAYRVWMQTAGIDGFKLVISDTASAEPAARAEGLGPTTWYEFQVAALNYNGAGPPGPPGEPILTASFRGGVGMAAVMAA